MAQLKQPETTPYGNYYGHNARPDETPTTDTSLSSIQKQFWSSDDDEDDDDLLQFVARKAKARRAPNPTCNPESSSAIADSRRADQPVPIVIVAVGKI